MSAENNNKDVKFLENYLSKHPESILFARLADVYLGMDRIDEAIQMCEDGIKKFPYYATGHFVLGKGYLAKKLYEQAEKEFKRVLLFDAKYLSAHKLYGDLMKEIGWENTYESSYKRILQIDPLEDSIRSVIGDQLQETEEPDSTQDLPEFSMSPPAAESKPEIDFDMGKAEQIVDPSWLNDLEERHYQDEEGHYQETKKAAGENQIKATSETDIGQKLDFDIDAISPLPVTPEEEQMIFEDSETDEVSIKQPVTETDADLSDLDEKKAEEFSFILDDIFKDEVVEEKAKPAIKPEKTPAEDPKSAFDQETESFLKDFQMSEEPPAAPVAQPKIEPGPRSQNYSAFEAKPKNLNDS